ncbi:MAG: ABC transporter permease [Chloroflexi bacterium]|jgi:ABC-2 type transport system permease protein|nr:ABC transporter permease [Chloroflexota bacterium]MBT7080536.1 ABC transporter permease [Chloroflexota bacterium]MBT7289640.1 ABC transporter permease [Chloroflexota bacterium]
MNTLLKLSWVELKLFIREPITMIFTFALPLISLFVLSEVFGTTPQTEGGEIAFRGVAPTDYYISAYVGLVIAAVGLISLPVHLSSYKEKGVLRRFRASSISVKNLLSSQVIVTFIITLICVIILFIAAKLAYDVTMPNSPGLLILAFIPSVLCFAAIGVLLGALLPTARAAQGVGLLLFFVMFFLGGSGPPFDVMSPTLQTVGDFTPMKWAVIAMQDVWLVGFGWNWTAFGVVIGIMVGAWILAIRLFRWD